MQTNLAPFIRDTDAGREADSILRKCTHCGFCLATCPTYRLLGDELDSPRGRIYQVKQLLEGAEPTRTMQLHLDRCLTCRACETTCPSGVQYGRLADIGRQLLAERVPRPRRERLLQRLLRAVLPHRPLFGPLLGLGRAVRPLLPGMLRRHVPSARRAPWPAAPARARRRVVLFEGCVQPALVPAINAHTARVLAELGIEAVRVPGTGCCGAIDQHLGHAEKARARMRHNLDAWTAALEAGADAIVVNASGCGAQLAEYEHALAADPKYGRRARQATELAVDPVQLLEPYADRLQPAAGVPTRIAFHAPCTLQHGLGLGGRVERLLQGIGFELTPVADAHICCGSAGTYSVLQPELAHRLRDDKVRNLEGGGPELIATANIGCLTHIQTGTGLPVRHWLELVRGADAG
ncbi:MAG: glycolate oxidase subunit GlcF [Halofilum sp. (in: g-proteobacteria)]|nr:glycolate oxidase subunit GlcF [Halofilum sp. (in: g-proteobacteria)]